MPNNPEDLQDAHNQGQTDASENQYNQPVPVNPIDYLVTPEDTIKDWEELNEKYDEGWKNAHDQS